MGLSGTNRQDFLVSIGSHWLYHINQLNISHNSLNESFLLASKLINLGRNGHNEWHSGDMQQIWVTLGFEPWLEGLQCHCDYTNSTWTYTHHTVAVKMSLVHTQMVNHFTSNNQTWGQFHFVNSNQFHLVKSNSTSNLTNPNLSIPIPFFTDSFLPWVGIPNTYSEYLVVMEEILYKNGKLICGFTFFVAYFNSNYKFINCIFFK